MSWSIFNACEITLQTYFLRNMCFNVAESRMFMSIMPSSNHRRSYLPRWPYKSFYSVILTFIYNIWNCIFSLLIVLVRICIKLFIYIKQTFFKNFITMLSLYKSFISYFDICNKNNLHILITFKKIIKIIYKFNKCNITCI